MLILKIFSIQEFCFLRLVSGYSLEIGFILWAILLCRVWFRETSFGLKPKQVLLPVRRYASAGYNDRNVSVSPSVPLSVCPSARHAPVLCQNEES